MKDAIDVKIKPKRTWITIHDFMWRDLELKGLELLVYGYIHQFQSVYTTLEDMADIIGINIKTLIKILKELEAKRLIYKHQITLAGNCKRNIYSVRFRDTGEMNIEDVAASIKECEERLKRWYTNVLRDLGIKAKKKGKK